VLFSPDGKTLIAGAGGVLRSWALEGERGGVSPPVRTLQVRLSTRAGAVSPDGKHLACGAESGVVYILRLPR
jgi:hypothetical protein